MVLVRLSQFALLTLNESSISCVRLSESYGRKAFYIKSPVKDLALNMAFDKAACANYRFEVSSSLHHDHGSHVVELL